MPKKTLIKLPNDKIEEFKYDYINNIRQWCAYKYNVSKNVIDRWAKELNLKKYNNPFLLLNTKEFECDYLNHSTEWCSEKYGFSRISISKWARKLNIPRKSLKWHDYINYELTEEQYEIIIGTMLGDSSLLKVSDKNNSHYATGHSLNQYEYLDGIYKKLLPLSSKSIIGNGNKIEGIDDNNKIINKKSEEDSCCGYWTMRHPIFTKLERKWYKRDENGEYILKPHGDNGRMERIKIVPTDLELTPRILAYWFFDDGSLNRHKKSITLSTQGFLYEECEFLVEKLKNTFGFKYVKIACRKDVNNSPEIHINQYDFFKFIDIVDKFNCYDCLKYKTDVSKIKKPWYFIDGAAPPRSKVGRDLTNKIIELAKCKFPYEKIAEKLELTRGAVVRVIRGRSQYNKQDFSYEKIYHSSGYLYVSWCSYNKKWIVSKKINNENIYMGEFSDKKLAISLSKDIKKLVNSGITNLDEYLKLKRKYE